ncbi:MAG: response regulator [Chitinivibrionales bacterium]|nr:response regulator [Chitinivibrionales bacterium]
MNKKKQVLLAQSNSDIKDNLIQLLIDMNVKVIQAADEHEDKISAQAKRLDCCIVDLDIPQNRGINLIRNLTKMNTHVQVVAIIDKLTNPVKIRLRMMGIRHILERPLKKAAFIETVTAALNEKKKVQKPQGQHKPVQMEETDRFSLLVAHNDTAFYQKICDLCINEGHDVYHATDEMDFIKKVQIGYYTIIFITEECVQKIVSTIDFNHLFTDKIKPILFVLDGERNETMASLHNFPFIVHLPFAPTVRQITAALQDVIPRYLHYKQQLLHTPVQKQMKPSSPSFFGRWIYMIRIFVRKSRLLFYIAIVLIAAVIAYIVSTSKTAFEQKKNDLIQALEPQKIEKIQKILQGGDKD